MQSDEPAAPVLTAFHVPARSDGRWVGLVHTALTAPAAGLRRKCARRALRLLSLALVCAVLLQVLAAAFGGSLLGRTCQLAMIWAPVVLVRTPEAIVQALESSGPVFIKLAQWLSTRRDLLSAELCDAMGQLHERVQLDSMPGDWLFAEQTVPGLRVGELLGGGCIAQVFTGELSVQGGTTRQVAVKVRRRGVSTLMRTDVALLRWTAWWAEWLRPDLQWLAMELAVDHFGEYLLQQADLRIEAANLKSFARNFRFVGSVRIPRVFVGEERVLVTDIALGVSLSEFVKQKHDDVVRKAVFESLTDLMARMILRDNFIHGDLHPGNIFVSTGPLFAGGRAPQLEITLIDAGISIEMSSNLTRMARNSMRAAFNMDALGLGKAVVRLHVDEGLSTHGRDLDRLEHKLGYLLLAGCFMCDEDIWGEMFESYEAYRGSRVSEYFVRMMTLLSEHKVRIAPPLWSLMTAFALVEGSVQELGYGVNVLRSARPYLFRPGDVLGRIGSLLRIANSEKRHRSSE